MFKGAEYNPVDRFCGLAEVYGRNRPTYPDEALDFVLCDRKPGGRIADIGSGTGILSRALAVRGWDIIGIDPNAQMRVEAERTPCPAPARPPVYAAGRAEATGLTRGEVELVIVAQAFHWFDAEAALREFHRILSSGGRVALLWNQVDESDALSKSYWQVLHDLATDPEVVRHPHHLAGRALLGHPLFRESTVRTFANRQTLDEPGLLGRACSASFAPREGPKRDELIDRMRALFAQHQRAGEVTLHYETVVYTALGVEQSKS